MGKQKVYGKRIGAISLASYTRFAADSSGSDTSPEVSVLREVSHNARIVAQASISPLGKNAKHINKSDKIVQPITPIRLRVSKDNEITRTPISRIEDGQNNTVSSSPVRENRSTPSAKKLSSRAVPPQTNVTIPQQSQRRSPRKAGPVPLQEDQLSTLFDTLKLKDSPECSILVPQTPAATSQPVADSISPQTRSYLSPVLSCKNVTPIVSEFSEWMEARDHLTLEKVGEGSFGEVFRASSADGKAVILKLMPLNPQKGRGSKSFTSVASAANEIRLLERMQRVPGFVEFRGACVLVGRLPKKFIDLWKEYKSSGRTVESRDPSKKTSYSTDQLWLLLEMSDAGRNLEPGQYAPPGETAVKGGKYLGLGRTWDIFWEVVKSVAKAEYWAQFEHRDLHLGNVCARDTLDIPDKEDLTLISSEAAAPIPVNRSKLVITIIDYSLSRAFMEKEDDVLFYDFRKDKHILKGEGDLQYDMYRYMAAAIGDRSPREYVPQTNVVWLWYLLNRLLAMTKDLSARARAKKRGFVTQEARIRDILNEVQRLTNPEHMQHWEIDSAAALLGIGIERGWLAPDDVFE